MKKFLTVILSLVLLAGCGHPVTVGLAVSLSQPTKKDKPVYAPGIRITTQSLPDTVIGQSYSVTVQTEGGSLPLSWGWSGSSG